MCNALLSPYDRWGRLRLRESGCPRLSSQKRRPSNQGGLDLHPRPTPDLQLIHGKLHQNSTHVGFAIIHSVQPRSFISGSVLSLLVLSPARAITHQLFFWGCMYPSCSCPAKRDGCFPLSICCKNFVVLPIFPVGDQTHAEAFSEDSKLMGIRQVFEFSNRGKPTQKIRNILNIFKKGKMLFEGENTR